ncbi:hypothetical protein M5C72_07115 [Companilactobacillus allii]|uniref:Uncharacterized protein n=1 Tax=Companilactobacillus allii TaxID=1847728 RepID=A0A1P8Q4T6_9LACO|nr:hypothetical protein [Companilactobacillus allii]APX72867.1 hypothetical protein BTM29_10030 [Companilactobacillus allii]USQ67655.1 hypothetical protein M5C72_07115 [Companilactobacillus allii]
MELFETINSEFYVNDYGGIDIPANYIKNNCKQAADVINELCNYYFDNHSFDELPIEQDKINIKKSMCAQIEHFYELNGTTELASLSKPTGVTIGNFSMSGIKQASTGMKSLISRKAIRYLKPTGLLYRGVGQY